MPIIDLEETGERWMISREEKYFLSACNGLLKVKKVYIHCDRGCDRTGVFCAILEGVLGASADDIKMILNYQILKEKATECHTPMLP